MYNPSFSKVKPFFDFALRYSTTLFNAQHIASRAHGHANTFLHKHTCAQTHVCTCWTCYYPGPLYLKLNCSAGFTSVPSSSPSSSSPSSSSLPTSSLSFGTQNHPDVFTNPSPFTNISIHTCHLLKVASLDFFLIKKENNFVTSLKQPSLLSSILVQYDPFFA